MKKFRVEMRRKEDNELILKMSSNSAKALQKRISKEIYDDSGSIRSCYYFTNDKFFVNNKEQEFDNLYNYVEIEK